MAAVPGLSSYVSRAPEHRLSGCGAWAQQLCLPGCRAQAQWLRCLGSAVVIPGLQSTGSVWAQQLCLPGCRAQAQWLRCLGSAVVSPGLQSTGSVATVPGLSNCVSSGSRAQAQWLWCLGSAVMTPGLQSTGSVAAVPGLSSCDSRATEHRLSGCGSWAWLLHGAWKLPRPRTEPESPALAGGFFTSGPPRKS